MAGFINNQVRGRRTARSGASLVEAIFYVVIIAILLLTVTNTFLTMRGAYQQMKLSSNLQNSAIVAMDRMEREIRNATNVDMVNCVFSSNPGTLTLIGKDNSGAAIATQFLLDANGVLHLKRGTSVATLAEIGPLTDSSAKITSLIFRLITGTRSYAVKIEMVIKPSTTMPRTDHFYSTVIIGGST